MQANRNDIPVGREHAISRKALAYRWHTSEREARAIVADFRAAAGNDGYAILSTAGTPSGYWRSNDPDEIRTFIAETYSRARNTFLAVKDAKRVLKTLQAKQEYTSRLEDRV